MLTRAPDSSASGRQVVWISLFLILSWLPAFFAPGLVSSVASLHHLAEGPRPFLVPAHWLILYVLSPLVVASACVLFLSPGLFLSLAWRWADNLGQWLLTGFASSLVIVSTAAAVVQWLAGTPIRGRAFAVVVAGCSLISLGVLVFRLLGDHKILSPFASAADRSTLVSLFLAPHLLLLFLTPKFYWESLNGDGAHAFESARLLLAQSLPFFPAEAGAGVAAFPGPTSVLFVLPLSWFVRLFGEIEASARLPYLLFLVVLYGAVVALVEKDRAHPLRALDRWMVWIGLLAYTVTMSYSATFNPYFADIALPATQDTLMMVCLIGFMIWFMKGDLFWTAIFALFTYAALPNGLLLMCLWLASFLLIWRPRPWRKVSQAAGIVFCCMIAGALLPRLLSFFQLPSPGNEYGLGSLLGRLMTLQWSDWQRVACFVVPGGILPALFLVVWRWQDRVAKALTLLVTVYFLFFYFQFHTALHYFVPAMILPIIVFWRAEPLSDPARRPALLSATLVAGALALYLSLPVSFAVHTHAREFGTAIEVRAEGYWDGNAEPLRRAMILDRLVPNTWDPRVPAEIYGGSPLQWNIYAHQRGQERGDINYVLDVADALPPAGMELYAREGEDALYVRSMEVLRRHRAMRPPTPAGARIYVIPRGVLFPGLPLEGGPRPLKVADLAGWLGVDLEALAVRLGLIP